MPSRRLPYIPGELQFITSSAYRRPPVFDSQVAGQRLNMGGSSAYLAHADAIGSTHMVTDPAGAVVWDSVFGPWGQTLQSGGSRPYAVFANLEWPINEIVYPSTTRGYNYRVYRWNTPDPGGRKVVKLNDPQTWNMYAYVTDNPTTLNDPGGLQSNCATSGGCSSNGESFEEDSMHFSDGRYGLDQITGLGIGMPEGLLNMLVSAQQQIGPLYRPSGGSETVLTIAGILCGETCGENDSSKENESLANARDKIAHVRLNGIAKWGANVDKHAGMAPPNMRGADAMLAIAERAVREMLNGADPTHGAILYNMRTAAQVKTGHDFWGYKVHTVSGPYNTPSPYKYIVTYGP